MKVLKIAVATAFLASPVAAFAQATPPSADPETPAISTPSDTNPDAPVAGENSFTEDQARERMEEAGFTEISGLVLDDSGIWRASANKDGAAVEVQLDYQGNITTSDN